MKFEEASCTVKAIAGTKSARDALFMVGVFAFDLALNQLAEVLGQASSLPSSKRLAFIMLDSQRTCGGEAAVVRGSLQAHRFREVNPRRRVWCRAWRPPSHLQFCTVVHGNAMPWNRFRQFRRGLSLISAAFALRNLLICTRQREVEYSCPAACPVKLALS